MTDLSEFIDVEDMLLRLEINNVHSASGGQQFSYSCPFSGHAHGDESPSAYMNAETTAWFCHGCKERGKTAVSFVAKVMGVAYTTAERFLREAYGVGFKEPEGGSMLAETETFFAPPAEPMKLRRPSSEWVQNFVGSFKEERGLEAFNYITDRGFDGKTITQWGMGYDEISGRLALPVFDLDGELVGFKGRGIAPWQRPKYLILGDRAGGDVRYGFDPYESGDVLYGLHRNPHAREKLVLVEGELDAVALAQAGVERVAAVGGSFFSQKHVHLIVQEVRSVVLFLDSNEAGWRGTQMIAEALLPHVPVFSVPDHEGDPVSMGPDLSLECLDYARSVLAA